LRGELKQLNGMSGGHGLVGTAAKLLGLGGAGSGAAAGAGGGAGAGAAVVGGGAVATKVAVLACCAAVVGGTVEAHNAAQPAKHPARQAVAHHVAAIAPLAVVHVVDTLAPPRHQAKPAEQVTRAATPTAATPVITDVAPASDSTEVDQSNGGMLAPDDGTVDSTTDAPPATPPVSGTSSGTSSAPPAAPTSPSSDVPKTGPDGSATGSTPPTAQGATTPGVTKTPS
jgi:hypothetical protein